MKNTSFLILILFSGLIISCSKGDDQGKIDGVNHYSGAYSLNYVTNSTACTNSTGIRSDNDLEITSNGRLKRKIYSLNSNNECVVSEILEGQITITHSFYRSPIGIIEYDNSEIIEDFYITPSVDLIHNQFIIKKKNAVQN